jgi:hypothetical protein
MLSKLDLQDLVGISSTRTFLLRSLAFSGHGGHSTRRGLSLLGLAHVGHCLLLRSRKVTIWTLEDRLTQRGFPKNARALHVSAPAAVFLVLVSGGFLFVFGCIFLSSITVYHNGSYFKVSFLALWVKNLFL